MFSKFRLNNYCPEENLSKGVFYRVEVFLTWVLFGVFFSSCSTLVGTIEPTQTPLATFKCEPMLNWLMVKGDGITQAQYTLKKGKSLIAAFSACPAPIQQDVSYIDQKPKKTSKTWLGSPLLESRKIQNNSHSLLFEAIVNQCQTSFYLQTSSTPTNEEMQAFETFIESCTI